MPEPRSDTEISQALEEVEVTLGVLVEHLGLDRQVREAIADRRAHAQRSSFEIERALGQAVQPDDGLDGTLEPET